ncbi:MAG: AsmA family protein, partial [Planctomycetota bacterium]
MLLENLSQTGQSFCSGDFKYESVHDSEVTKISKGLNSDKAARPVIRRIAFRWLRIGLTGAVCLGLALVLARWMLRHVAIGQIARLTQSEVQTKSVNVALDGSVLIEQLVLKPIRQEPDDYAIFKAETVHGRFSIGTFFRLRPRLDEVEISDFVLDARYNLETGRWNIADFLISAPKSGSTKLPLISLKNGTLMYSKVSNGQVQGVAVVPLDATLGPAGSEQGRYRYDIETAEGPWGFGKSRLTGFWKPGHVTIAGSFSSADIEAFEKVWRVYVVAAELEYDYDRSYSLKLVLRNLENERKPVGDKPVAPEPAFLKNLGVGSTLRRFFNRFDPQGRIDIELEAAGNLDHLTKSSLSGTVICRDVSICDRHFPYSVEHITGPIEITEHSAELKNLSGMHGPVELTFSGRFRGSGPKKEYDIRVGSKNMALDEDLYKALNPKYKRWWSSCSPSGVAEVNYRWVRESDGSRKKTLAVKLLNAEAVYERFPYPLSNLTGGLSFDSEGVTFADVVSQYGSRTITINGKIANHNTDRLLCDLAIDAQDIPLDATLAACLSQSQRRLYDQLNITGLADAEVKVLTPKDSTADMAIEAEIYVKEACLKPDYLPLAVSGASGRVSVTGDSIHIEDFKGNASSGTVSAAGRVRPGAEPNELQYDLVLEGKQVELDEGLLGLLPPSLKAAVSGLEPKGEVNYTAKLNKEAGPAQPDYRIGVECLGNSFNIASFPYPLENVSGTLSIAIANIGDGSVATIGDAGIPQGTRAVCVKGQLNQVNGESEEHRFDLELEKLWVFAAEDGRQYVDLGAVAVFSNCDLKPSTAITDLDAVVKLNGLYEMEKGFLSGRGLLRADSLRIAGNHLTELTADID